ncbi:hypothetical protein [Actinacidiphila reveromycinica]|nr:hypothetical protein [Streptomyces sp. SN-593]
MPGAHVSRPPVPAPAAAPPGCWLHGLPGIQSHQRSLLVWPDLLGAAGAAWVGSLLFTGTRLLSLGAPLPVPARRAPQPVRLAVWGGPGAEAPPQGVWTQTPDRPCWERMTGLWTAAGLTPLPPSARSAADWRHAGRGQGTELAGCASAQQLMAPLGATGARRLVCSVVSDPARRRTGVARACVRAVAGGAGAAALLEPGSGSDRFFAALEWTPVGDAYFYHH